MPQPSDEAVWVMTRYLRAHLSLFMLQDDPHAAMARWLLTDVVPYGMEITQTGDLETIQDREALKYEVTRYQHLQDSTLKRNREMSAELERWQQFERKLNTDTTREVIGFLAQKADLRVEPHE